MRKSFLTSIALFIANCSKLGSYNNKKIIPYSQPNITDIMSNLALLTAKIFRHLRDIYCAVTSNTEKFDLEKPQQFNKLFYISLMKHKYH